jgi:hypothetical protein
VEGGEDVVDVVVEDPDSVGFGEECKGEAKGASSGERRKLMRESGVNVRCWMGGERGGDGLKSK